MALAPGTRLGAYEILSTIGAGGMGEVYRAHDTTLGRDVALKTLPDSFLHDPDRIARFRREAQVLASLNHPHIAAIHGLEQDGDTRFLILELVEGETLAERLKAGPLPLDEALVVARQIVDALEAAHEKGIIHRDLKPANIAFTADGQAKVLDFGLAKAIESPTASNTSAALSPTITSPALMTGAGVILGTAAYMAPEQAKGRAADKRGDIWAFGCVLYEMLTGRRAFDGEDLTEVIASVVKTDPDWQALPPDIPEQIRLLIKRCLERDRRARVSDISVAKFLMTETIAPPAPAGAPPVTATAFWLRGRGALAVGLVAATLAGALATWTMFTLKPAPRVQTSRFAIMLPPGPEIRASALGTDLAISSDGTRIVYAGGSPREPQLLVRAIDQLDASPLHVTELPRAPFMSPDGRWIGFFAGSEMKKVSIAGGPPFTVCRFTGVARGASWASNDTIIFATATRGVGLQTVPAGGGEPNVLTKPAPGEAGHWFPFVLPGNRAVLFTVGFGMGIENQQIVALDLSTGQRKTVLPRGSQAVYVESGHLVYANAGSLWAARFDPKRLEVSSDPIPVVEQVPQGARGAAPFAVSRTGTLVYVPGGIATGTARSLVWVTRQGREEPIKAPPRAYFFPRLSPDGSRLALDIRDQQFDIWVFDLRRETLTPLTTEPGVDAFPVWTPDGRRIVFASVRTGAVNLYWQAADGTGTAERLTASERQQWPTAISPDGTRVVLRESVPNAGIDVNLLDLGGPRRSESLVSTTFDEQNGTISPNGRWLAYESNQSGQNQIYVRPFPKVEGGQWQISTAGGTMPLWARNGRELFYLDASGRLTAVPVETGETFSAANPTTLFETRYFAGAAGRTYDVSPDGQRFLMIKENAGGDQTATSASIIVVENWFEELKARVPPKQ